IQRCCSKPWAVINGNCRVVQNRLWHMYARPFVSFIYFKLAIRCCPPVFDNFSVKLLFIQQKSYDFINEFLILSSIAVIMIHNAVERCNMLADCDEMSKALPNAELLF